MWWYQEHSVYDNPEGVRLVREWQYWTLNKLQILADYLPAFNRASTKSSERVYIDLMAGEPQNRDAATGEMFDGSARLALSARPGFTRWAFCEQEPIAKRLRVDLEQRFPGRPFRVYAGDCNDSIDRVLGDLADVRWAPVFAFVDQQAREVRWSTLEKLARFRRNSKGWKTELWILSSPAMIARGVTGTKATGVAAEVDLSYGTSEWRHIQAARDARKIIAEEYREEMVNLLRWRLETLLGYQATARIPMRMSNNMPIYDMVFATDHEAGTMIMADLYRKAAARQPEMIAEARVRAARKREERRVAKTGLLPLFHTEPEPIPVEALEWEPSPCWDPTSRPWWPTGS